MSVPFRPIAIGELDQEESYKRSGDFWEKVFFLHPEPPEGWGELFREVWAGAACTPKRPARIENGRLATICLASEIKGELMEYLHAAVDRTNETYRPGPAA